jgi:hypothetical protein
MTTVEKRSSRTTQEQYSIILNFLEENKIMLLGKTPITEKKVIDNLWHDLATQLNESRGLNKTVEQWKRVNKQR